MRRLVLPLVLVVLAGACSSGERPATSSPPDSTLPAVPPTTQTTAQLSTTTLPAPPVNSLIISRLGGIEVLQDGARTELPGDADYPVAVALDDLAGGLVYQYETTPEQFPLHSVLHSAAGASTPEVVLYAEPGRTLRLLDLEEVGARTTLLYLEGDEGSPPDTLLIADIAGGAPEVIVRADPGSTPGSAGVSPTAIIGGSLSSSSVAVVWWYGDLEAECSYIDVVDLAGTALFGPFPDRCGELDLAYAALSPDGTKLAYAGDGVAEIVDLSSMDTLGAWPVVDAIGLDFDGTTMFVTVLDEYLELSLSGEPPITRALREGATRVTAGRGPIEITPGTFLGGVRSLSGNCSAAGMPTIPDPQGGLPEAVAALRDGIVAAATSCDIEALKMLAGTTLSFSFGGEPDAARFWRWNEQEGYGALARMVDVLALPFVIEDWPEGRIYTWPSAFQAEPTDEDWEALSAVFNEEDVDLFKEYGAYIGMRVGIAEDGTWLFAIEGD